MGWVGPLTERQVLAWEEWFDLDDNRPGKAEYYLMALRATLINLNRAEGVKAVSVDDMRIELTRGEARPQDPKVVSGWMKGRARARFGDRLTVVTVDKDGNVLNTVGPSKP